MSSDVASYLGEIQVYFGKQYTDEQYAFMQNRLLKSEFTRLAYIRALKDIEQIDSPFLPTPKDVLTIVEKAARELARQDPPAQTKTNIVPADRLQFEMARKLRGLIFGGKATRQQILDSIRKADSAKPGCGWMECGTDLEKYYTRCKLPLDKPPANFISFHSD